MTTSGPITRYVRYTDASGTFYGTVDGDTIRQLDGDLFANPRPTGKTVRVADVKLEVPVDPMKVQKVIGLTSQFSRDGTPHSNKHLRLFAKLPTSLIAHGEDIEVPPECHHIHHEDELVVVIGKSGRYISEEDAPGHVFGVTVGNEVADGTWYSETDGANAPARLLAKSPDTWGPVYHTIVQGIDYNDLAIEARLDGHVAVQARTSQFNNTVAQTIAYLSHYMTLEPGDLIFMGNPNQVPEYREMEVGQTIEVEIEGIGVLRNRVVAMKGGIAGPWWLKEVAPPPAAPRMG